MQTSETLRILKALAEGVDPYTGEVLPPNGPYQHSNTISALLSAIRALEQLSAKRKFEDELFGVNLGPLGRTGG